MPVNIFISYDHDDQQQINGFHGIKHNPNHDLDFRNHSLQEPVTDRHGNIIKFPPSDPRSKPVRDEIKSKFERASRLVVLIGDRTFTSEWVDWEVRTFYAMKHSLSGQNTWKRIRGMRLKGADTAALPPALLDGRSTQPLNWNPEALDHWLDQPV